MLHTLSRIDECPKLKHEIINDNRHDHATILKIINQKVNFTIGDFILFHRIYSIKKMEGSTLTVSIFLNKQQIILCLIQMALKLRMKMGHSK